MPCLKRRLRRSWSRRARQHTYCILTMTKLSRQLISNHPAALFTACCQLFPGTTIPRPRTGLTFLDDAHIDASGAHPALPSSIDAQRQKTCPSKLQRSFHAGVTRTSVGYGSLPGPPTMPIRERGVPAVPSNFTRPTTPRLFACESIWYLVCR